MVEKAFYSYNIHNNTHINITLPEDTYTWIEGPVKLKCYKNDDTYALNCRNELLLFKIDKERPGSLVETVNLITYPTILFFKIFIVNFYFFGDDYLILLNFTCSIFVYDLKSNELVLSIDNIYNEESIYHYCSSGTLVSKNDEFCEFLVPNNSCSEHDPNMIQVSLVRVEYDRTLTNKISYFLVDNFVISKNVTYSEMLTCVLEKEFFDEEISIKSDHNNF